MAPVIPTQIPLWRNGSHAGWPHFGEILAGTHSAGIVVRVSDGGLTAFVYDHSLDPLDPASYTTADLSAIPAVVAALGLTDPGNGVSGVTVEDDHFMLGSLPDDQGRLWIMGNGHADPLHVVFSGQVGGVPDLTTWNTVSAAAMPWAASGSNTHTYNKLDRLPTGELIWFMDQQESASVSRGRDIIAYYLPLGRSVANIQAGGTAGWRPVANDTGSGTWTGEAGTARGEFASSENVGDSPAGTSGGPDPGPANRVYINAIAVEHRPDLPNGFRLHAVIVWRTTDGDPRGSQQLGYVYADEVGVGSLDAWRNIDGDPVPMPLTWANRALFTITEAPQRTTGTNCLAIKEDGRPAFVIDNGYGGVGELAGYGEWIRVERIADSWVLTNLGETSQGHPSLPDMVAAGPSRETYTVTTFATTVQMRTDGGNVGGPSGTIPNGASPAGDRWEKGGPIDSSGTVAFGTQVASYAEVFYAGIDPVRLARTGLVDLLIPDGDSPRVYTFGHQRPIRV